MKFRTLLLPLAVLFLFGCSAASITGPPLESQEAGELTPAGGKCNPDAYPC